MFSVVRRDFSSTDSTCRGVGLWDFSLAPVEILRKLEKNGLFRFTAPVDVAGVPIHVEILTGTRFGRPAFAVAFAFDRESYGKLAEQLSGIGVDFLDKLGFEFEVKTTCLCKLSSQKSIVTTTGYHHQYDRCKRLTGEIAIATAIRIFSSEMSPPNKALFRRIKIFSRFDFEF